ncbi:ATP-binding protein [Streptomyces inusitatus]|uniref:ATP-binding protein n=1 Tax=Streptomyces inusitatus TaxID=68221 RepID=UPI00167EA23D|nr:ATP-binding protein [Streptomyces inusitatus]
MSLTVRPSEIRRIRRAVMDHLDGRGLGESAFDIALVVTELLANVHEHADGICELDIEPREGRLILTVRDTVMAPPTLRHDSPSAENGRGLLLVDALTEHWETTVTATGKVVTCTFRTP